MTVLPLFASTENVDDFHEEPALAFSRSGGVFGAHAYHTKVPPEAIEPYLHRYSMPGDLVCDPFCGSGMTGVASAKLGRRAVLSDLSPAAVHIARNYTTPCDPVTFAAAAEAIGAGCRATEDELYRTACHQCGAEARTAYLVWSDVRACPYCRAELRIWDFRATSLRKLECPQCHETFQKSRAGLLREEPVQVNLHCGSCRRVERDPLDHDRTAANVDRASIDTWFPKVPFDDSREMWRRGHGELGIREIADFYTPRNLKGLSVLHAEIANVADERIREALLFAFTAIVNRASKRYQWNSQRPTNVLGGTLYVASLRYEFNVFDLWRRKVAAVRRMFEVTSKTANVDVHLESATTLSLPDRSVDYCFTDPPFGANIVYSDCSILWESWLGQLTDRTAEAIVTRHLGVERGGKDVDGYQVVMTAAFKEIGRVLKPTGHATLVFQNTDPKVWDSIVAALAEAELAVVEATTLHKTQPSFKGVKAQQEGERVAATDVVLTLRHPDSGTSVRKTGSWMLVDSALRSELQRVSDTAGRQRSIGHLYAVALAAAIANQVPLVYVSFHGLQSWLEQHCIEDGGGWRLMNEVSTDGVSVLR